MKEQDKIKNLKHNYDWIFVDGCPQILMRKINGIEVRFSFDLNTFFINNYNFKEKKYFIANKIENKQNNAIVSIECINDETEDITYITEIYPINDNWLEEIKNDKYGVSIIMFLLKEKDFKVPNWFGKLYLQASTECCKQSINDCEELIVFFERKINELNNKKDEIENEWLYFYDKKIMFNKRKKLNYLEMLSNNLDKKINKYVQKKELILEKQKKWKNQLLIDFEKLSYIIEQEKNKIINSKDSIINFESLRYFLSQQNLYINVKGCYVIKNSINGKVYVGQSKNIRNRIKQHFNDDASPKNEIFLYDYMNVPKKFQNDLFEIAIIPCETKDELDELERKLIKKYDSYNFGYNRTQGNK